MSRLATPIRKNDNVLVITGKDRGKRGRVLRVVPEKNRLIVEGVNMIKRHTKPNPGKNIKGGIVEREASLHASNVQLVCPECGAQTRMANVFFGLVTALALLLLPRIRRAEPEDRTRSAAPDLLPTR